MLRLNQDIAHGITVPDNITLLPLSLKCPEIKIMGNARYYHVQ